jgi:hypothetical protein
METKEYRYTDADWLEKKERWSRGQWDSEPDKKQWRDEETGYPCLFKRNPVGCLCGYVGVSEGHPFFAKSYNEIYELLGDEDAIVVHGGLTYTDFCQEGEEAHSICHVVEPGEDDRVWWLGFDCAHCGDLMPGTAGLVGTIPGDTYKNVEYVETEVRRLARQLKEVEDGTSGPGGESTPGAD